MIKIEAQISPEKILSSESRNLTTANNNSNSGRANVREFRLNFSKYSEDNIYKFCDNSIHTSKYTILTFLPLAILNQYKSIFNWYYLVNVAFSAIPQISSVQPFSCILPYVIVLCINVIKDGVCEFRKYNNDKRLNQSECEVFIEDSSKFESEKWRNIMVGNVIKIKNDRIIPADVLVLKTANEDGVCYMQTMNLDGESNLKPREALDLTQKNLCYDSKSGNNNFVNFLVDKCDIDVEVDEPNPIMYESEGTFHCNRKKIFFDYKNVLLRGARLKNTEYVYGLVIYTGKETKLFQNINKSSLKFSKLDKTLNYIVLFLICFTIFTTLSWLLMGYLFMYRNSTDYENNLNNHEYIYYHRKQESTGRSLELFRIFTGVYQIFSNFMPISIMITYAFIKGIQALLLEVFSTAYAKENGDKLNCLNSNLLDELGMVKYIFSDKTGTLTQNELEFKACSIFDFVFDDEEENPLEKKLSMPFPPNTSCRTILEKLNFLQQSKLGKAFKVEQILSVLYQKNIAISALKNKNDYPISTISEAVYEFFMGIALNHDILKEEKKGKTVFEGVNPDEKTLVSTAYELGFHFVSRDANFITVDLFDQKKENFHRKKFKVLQKFDFTSERQSSSIIVQSEKGEISLYMKGSDRKIFETIDAFSKNNLLHYTIKSLDNFAKKGLRTLCYAFKRINNMDYKKWEAKYIKLKYACMNNKQLYPKLEELIKEIENDCILLGVTGLEDKLQNEVRTDVKNFIEAGINFWMITGDRMDTAESIGYSCRIIDNDTEVFKLRESKSDETLLRNLKIIRNKVDSMNKKLKALNKKNKDKYFKRIKEATNFEGFINYKRKRSNSFGQEKKNSFELLFNNEKNNYKERIKHYERKYSESPRKQESKELDSTAVLDVVLRNDEDLNNTEENLSLIAENVNMLRNSIIDENKNTISIEKENNNYESILKLMDKKTKNQPKNKQYSDILISNKINNIKFSSLLNKKNFIANGIERKIDTNIELTNAEEEQNIITIQKINVNRNMKPPFSNNAKYIPTSKRKLPKIAKDETKINNNIPPDDIAVKKPPKKSEIPSKEEDFNKYFELCQNKLYEANVQEIERPCFFQFKNLYPKPQAELLLSREIQLKFTLILEGQAISRCISNPELAEVFWYIIQKSRSLICCRSSPTQKSEIVNFVKKKSGDITLAIGDGGNDVNMIKTANIGIGLFGKEGNQAAYNSDFAISQFKYLKRLIFIDGRLSLMKNANFCYLYFLKNVLYTVPVILSVSFGGFSGKPLYDDWLSMAFNLLLAIFPVVSKSCMDEDFNPNLEDYSEKHRKYISYLLPDIFKEYRNSNPFNLIKFIVIFSLGLLMGTIIFFIPFGCSFLKIMDEKGYTYSFWNVSLIIFVTVLVVHYFQTYEDTNFYNNLIIAFIIAQLILLVLIVILYPLMGFEEGISNCLYHIMGNIQFYLIVLLTCGFICVPYYLLRKAEFFFGEFIVDLIKRNKFERFYIQKYYKQEVEKLTRVKKGVIKFKKIYRDQENGEDKIYDNRAMEQMKKIVKGFRDEKQRNKNWN